MNFFLSWGYIGILTLKCHDFQLPMANKNHNLIFLFEVVSKFQKSELNEILTLAGYESQDFKLSKKKSNSIRKIDKPKKIDNLNNTIPQLLLIELYDCYISGLDFSQTYEVIKTKFSAKQIANHSNKLENIANEFILTTENIDKMNIDNIRKVQINIYKKLSLMWGYLYKGINFDLKVSIDALYRKAINYELYSEALTILSFKVLVFSHKLSTIQIDELKKEIEELTLINMLKEKAELYQKRIQVMYTRKISIKTIVSDVINNIKELDDDRPKISSDTWRLAYNNIFLELLQQQGKYEEGDSVCLDSINIYLKNPYISSSVKIGFSYLQLANNQIYGKKYSECYSNAMIAKSKFHSNSINMVSTYELIFYSTIYMRKYDLSIETIEKGFTLYIVKFDPIYNARWSYFRSYLYFIQGDYKQAQIMLNEASLLDEDKEGWGLGIRILIIYILIAREFYDEIEFALENFKRQIIKLKKTTDLRGRYQIIYKLIYKLYVNRFDYKLIKNKYAKWFEQIDSNDPEYKWEPRTAEVISFSEWFNNQINRNNPTF